MAGPSSAIPAHFAASPLSDLPDAVAEDAANHRVGDHAALKSAALGMSARSGFIAWIADFFGLGDRPTIRSLVDRMCRNPTDASPEALQDRIDAFDHLRELVSDRHKDSFAIDVGYIETAGHNRVDLHYEIRIGDQMVVSQTLAPRSTRQGMTLLAALPNPDTIHGDHARAENYKQRKTLFVANVITAAANEAVANFPLTASGLQASLDNVHFRIDNPGFRGWDNRHAGWVNRLNIATIMYLSRIRDEHAYAFARSMLQLPGDRESMTLVFQAGPQQEPIYVAALRRPLTL